MNKRILKISSYINDDDKVIDVGCDQALLSIELAKRKIHSYASDINENIILRAKENAKNGNYDEYITFLVSDGLKNTPNIDTDTLTISGMGAYNILNIIKENKKSFKKIITISNNNYDILRREMNLLNYRILNEEIIKEKGKYYNLIIFVPGKETLSDTEILFGKNHTNKELYHEMYEEIINKLLKIYNKTNSEDVLFKIEALKKAYK